MYCSTLLCVVDVVMLIVEWTCNLLIGLGFTEYIHYVPSWIVLVTYWPIDVNSNCTMLTSNYLANHPAMCPVGIVEGTMLN